MKIALVGNQNSGKTSLFNILTDNNAKIGNYPGVTIEKKTGIIKGTNHELIDLPGIYSLSSYTTEENITINYILNEKPDLIINIIDSTAFERSMYLTLILMELNIKMILVLNMNDIALKRNIIIDSEELKSILGLPVIKISALKNEGIDELINTIDKVNYKKNNVLYDYNIEKYITRIENLLDKNIENKRFISIKLLEKDTLYNKYKTNEIDYIVNSAYIMYPHELYEEVIEERYKCIEKVKIRVLKENKNKKNISDYLDKIFLNKYLSFIIFVFIMFLIYYLSVGLIGKSLSIFVNKALTNFSIVLKRILKYHNVNNIIISLIIDGILSGITSVLTFIPQLTILFICLSILETTGYMSRISMILDNALRRIGLSGKSLIPFIIGCGCSVPGILGSRIIEDDNKRKMTSILTPFIPCSAKLPIIVMLSSYFYKENQVLIIFSLYILAIIVIIISSLLMKKYIYKDNNDTYIYELPEYKMIDIKYIFNDVYDKISAFIKRAGSVILICSIIVWFLSSFSLKLKYGVSIDNTILAFIGKKISWIFYPMIGINSWECSVSIIQGLIAKEQVISSLSIISTLSNNNFILTSLNKYSAYSFIVFNLFSIPCIASISTMKKELNSFKSLLLVMLYQFVFAWTLSTFIYQITTNFGFITIIILIPLIISLYILLRNNRNNCNKCPYHNKCHE